MDHRQRNGRRESPPASGEAGAPAPAPPPAAPVWAAWLQLAHTALLAGVTAALALWVLPATCMVWSEAAALHERRKADEEGADSARRRALRLEAERLHLAEENARLARDLNRALRER